MEKFNYKKWITENKHGEPNINYTPINEQGNTNFCVGCNPYTFAQTGLLTPSTVSSQNAIPGSGGVCGFQQNFYVDTNNIAPNLPNTFLAVPNSPFAAVVSQQCAITASYAGPGITGSGTTTTGSVTGSATGSSFCPGPSNFDVSGSIASSSPQLGDYGITQQFVNNMSGKNTGFYQNRENVLNNKWNSLVGNYPGFGTNNMPVIPPGQFYVEQNGYQAFCKGERPRQQVRIHNKITYIKSCILNPGSC